MQHKNIQLLNLLSNSTSLIGRRSPHRGCLSRKANPAKREISQHCGLLWTETTIESHFYQLNVPTKQKTGTSITAFKSYHPYLHNTNTLVSSSHSCAKFSGNSTSLTSVLNFRSQATCPRQPRDSEGSLSTRFPLGLSKFQPLKRCSLHLQLFPCMKRVSLIIDLTSKGTS